MALATQPDASAHLRDAAPVRGYHVAEPADVSSEQYLGSFACVIEAIVSVIKVWSSLHVHSVFGKCVLCSIPTRPCFNARSCVAKTTFRSRGSGGLQSEGSSVLFYMR